MGERGFSHAIVTMHAPARVEPASPEVSVLFTTDKNVSRGNVRRGIRFYRTKESASSPPGLWNSPFRFQHKGFGEAGNKNPSGAWAREGFGKSNFSKQPLDYSASMRARGRIDAKSHKLRRIQPRQIMFAFASHRLLSIVARYCPRRARVYDGRVRRCQGALRPALRRGGGTTSTSRPRPSSCGRTTEASPTMTQTKCEGSITARAAVSISAAVIAR